MRNFRKLDRREFNSYAILAVAVLGALLALLDWLGIRLPPVGVGRLEELQ